MELVPSFVLLLQQVAFVMTVPTFDRFVIVLTGWVFARRRIVTRMIQAANAVKTMPGRGRSSITRPSIACSPPPAGRWTNWGWRCSG